MLETTSQDHASAQEQIPQDGIHDQHILRLTQTILGGLAWPEVIHPGQTKLVVPKSSWKLVHSERESLGHSHFGGPKNCSTHFNHMLISHHHTGYTADTCDPHLVRKAKGFARRELGPNTSTGHQVCRRLDQWLPTLLHIAQGRIIWRDRFIVLNHVLHWYYTILHLEPRDACGPSFWWGSGAEVLQPESHDLILSPSPGHRKCAHWTLGMSNDGGSPTEFEDLRSQFL